MPQFTVNLPGGGQVVVNAKDAASAAGNVGGGNTGVVAGNRPNGGNPAPAAPAAPRPAAAAPTAAAPSPVSPPANSNLGDTNSQAQRALLRAQGYYIDASGVYAPGSGARVSDTFSGAQASQNTAPSPTQLPVINGTPVSPSNGSTGPQTGAIMYRSDPLYSTYFGPGTPGYSSTTAAGERGDPSLGATGPVTGQQSLTDYLTASGHPVGANGAPMPAQQGSGTQPNVNAPMGSAPPQTTTDSGASNGPPSYASDFAQPNPNGGFGPYMTTSAPELSGTMRYVENGKIIEKSTDQFGHPYYRTVGDAPGGDQSQPQPQAPGQPGAATPRVPGETVAQDQPATYGGVQDQVPLTMPDGKVVQVPREFYAEYLAAGEAQAAAAKQATQFSQGIEQGKLDVSRLVATYNDNYQKGILTGQTAQRAQDMALAQMKSDLDKQTLELNQLEAQRQQAGMTASIQRDQLQVQRNASRTARRSLPGIRYS